MLDSSSTSFSMPFLIWDALQFLPLFSLSFLFFFWDIFYICASPLHTWNILLSFLPPLPITQYTVLLSYSAWLYYSIFWIYSGKLFSPSVSCNFGPGVWTLCNSNILFLSFLLTLPLIKQGHVFLWAGCLWGC